MKFEDICREHRVLTAPAGHHHGRAGWLQLQCPFCQSGRWHLGYSLRGGYANCWRCGWHGVVETVAALLEIPATDARRLLGDDGRRGPPERNLAPSGRLQMPRGAGPLLPQHRDYLLSRGFRPTELEKLWSLGGLAIAPAGLSWRVLIPCYWHGRLVSWTARSISDQCPRRYVSARPDQEAVPRGRRLYGADYARHAVVVVEGPADVWRLGPGAVALLGMMWSREQVALIGKYPHRAICFDNEPAAQQRARRLSAELSMYPGRTEVIQLDAADPGEAPPREVAAVRRAVLGD